MQPRSWHNFNRPCGTVGHFLAWNIVRKPQPEGDSASKSSERIPKLSNADKSESGLAEDLKSESQVSDASTESGFCCNSGSASKLAFPSCLESEYFKPCSFFGILICFFFKPTSRTLLWSKTMRPKASRVGCWKSQAGVLILILFFELPMHQNQR